MPKFSIVIPTRDRTDTLEHCIQTCLTSYKFKVEVLVFDNSQYEGTKAVIERVGKQHGNTYIRYVAAPSDLAMSRSWECAVAASQGQYVTVIGDDDGMIPGSLELIENIIRQHPCNVIRFAQASYGWPANPVKQWQNRIQIPLSQTLRFFPGKWINDKVARFEVPYRCLPMIYNSFVSRTFLESLREKLGSLFSAASPDVESGFLFAQSTKQYLNCTVPVSIAGGSHRSNGITELMTKRDIPATDATAPSDFWSMNQDQGITWPPIIPEVRVLPMAIAEALIQTNARLAQRQTFEPMDAKELVHRCLDFLTKFPGQHNRENIEKLRMFASQQNVTWPIDIPEHAAPDDAIPFSPETRFLDLPVQDLGIMNIHDAAKLISRFFDYPGIAQNLRLNSHRDILWRKARSLVGTAWFYNRPRSWEIDA